MQQQEERENYLTEDEYLSLKSVLDLRPYYNTRRRKANTPKVTKHLVENSGFSEDFLNYWTKKVARRKQLLNAGVPNADACDRIIAQEDYMGRAHPYFRRE